MNTHQPAAPLREGPGSRIGHYKLLQVIGEGGFGSVFMAEQEQPVARKVALKIIKLGMDTRQVVARFEQERQALAMMDHPNIARVLDAGATETGRPYFVMDLVKGDPIVDYCDKNNLTIDERLELFAQVCGAVQHAHGKGVIHRDLKPSNILVGTQDGRPMAKVIDFGIAKATSQKLTDKTLFTEHQQVIGTLQYMSPEQAEGSLDIDTRTDVYSLGVLLYELLTGSTPFDKKTIKDAMYGELQRMIREVEPPKPSTRLSDSHDTLVSIAAHRRVEPKRLGTLLRGDLDWIVMKALEKDRSRRYETANGLAADIRRHLAGEAVVAAPPSAGYRLRKFVRRNKGKVVAAAAIAASLLVGVVAFAWQASIAQTERDRAVLAETETKKRADQLAKVADFQARMLGQIDAKEAGVALLVDLRTRHAAALERSKVPPDERLSMRTAFERDLAIVNATDAAVDMLDGTILKPAAAAIEKQFKEQPVVEASLRQTLAGLYLGLGRYEDACTLQSAACTTYRVACGEEHVETLSARNRLNSMLLSQGKSGAAEAPVRDAVEQCRRVLGAEHAETLAALENLGELQLMSGQLGEAETTMRDVVDKSRRLLGHDNLSTLLRLDQLGVVLLTKNELVDAESCFREALAKFRQTQGNEHRYTLRALANLGSTLNRAHRLGEAETCFREALEIRRRTLGEEHPGTINSLNALGQLLQSEGHLAEADVMLREAVDKSRRVFGAEHPSTLTAISNLGVLLIAEDRCAEAVSLLAPIEAAARRTFHGDVAWRCALILAKLGSANYGCGNFSKAEAYLLEAYPVCATTRGESHPFTRSIADTIVDFYTQWQAVDPGKGHDQKAAEWQAKLDATTAGKK